eukprot:13686616-Ditylum_brightwellii.AAC.1
MTAYAAAATLPHLIEYSSSDKEEHVTHQYASDFDSIDGDSFDNRKIPVQQPRNAIESIVEIENGSSNTNMD